MGNSGSKAVARAFVLSFTLSAIMTVGAAFADGTTPGGATTTGPGVTSGFDSTLPPQFNMAQTAGMAQVFQSCMGNMSMPLQQLGQGMSSMATGGGAAPVMTGMGFGMDAVCPPADDSADSSSLTCDMFSPGGVFDGSLLRSKLQSINMALASVQCKQAKFDAVKAQVTCLSTQADVLSSEVASLQNAYQQNIQRMQQDVAKIKAVEADRDMQMADVQEKLTGQRPGDNAPQTGRKGLLKLKEDTMKLINEDMPRDVQQIKEGYNQLKQAQEALTEQVQTRTMALARDCFMTRTNPKYRCAPNGPPVTAKDYVLCRYQQNQNLGEGGVVEQNQNVQARANANGQGLDSLLSQMLGDAPQSAKIPTNPQDAQQALDAPPTTILTAADVENQYGDQLSQYNGKGLDIHDFVTKQVGMCFQRATAIVNREQKVANSQIGIAQFNLKKQKRDFDNQANTLLEKYSQQWSEDMAGLTGQNLPLNLQACKNGGGNVKANCLDDLRNNFEGLLQGNVKQSTMVMVIKGNDPMTTIKFNCQGLNGCITALQNTSSNLVTEKQRLETFKKNYVLKANQSVDNFTKQMAGMMSGQSQMLNNKLKQINSALASLGVSNAINIQPVQDEQLEKDDDGLPKPPKKALNLIGSQMSPPMLDVSSNNFSQALAGLGQGVQDLNSKLSKLNDAKNRLAILPSQCATKGVTAAATQLQTDMGQIANCGAPGGVFCDSSGNPNQNLSSLTSALDGLGSQYMDPTIYASLSSGTNICTAPPTNSGSASGAASGQTSTVTWSNPGQCQAISARIMGDIQRVRSQQNNAISNAGGAGI